MKLYSEWRVGPYYLRDELCGYMVYRLKDHRKGKRPGNVIIYEILGVRENADELADAINRTESRSNRYER